jgi:hypothetical protein
MDEIFGTNVQRYHLFTLMVFEHHSQRFTYSIIDNHKLVNKI